MGLSGKAWTEAKHPASTSSLLASLHHLLETNAKAVRSTVHHYPASLYACDDAQNAGPSSLPAENLSGMAPRARNRRITSWKMTEHMYRRHDNPFPTLARGLFTEEIEEGDEVPGQALAVEGNWGKDQSRERIVARGYDKFFNIGEVEWTEVSHTDQRSRLADSIMIVEEYGTPLGSAILPHAQVKWLSDPRFGSLPNTPIDRLETLSGNEYRGRNCHGQ